MAELFCLPEREFPVEAQYFESLTFIPQFTISALSITSTPFRCRADDRAAFDRARAAAERVFIDFAPCRNVDLFDVGVTESTPPYDLTCLRNLQKAERDALHTPVRPHDCFLHKRFAGFTFLIGHNGYCSQSGFSKHRESVIILPVFTVKMNGLGIMNTGCLAHICQKRSNMRKGKAVQNKALVSLRSRGISLIMASATVFGFAPVLATMSYAGGNNSINMALIRAVVPLPVFLLLAKGDIRYTRTTFVRCLVLGITMYSYALMLYSSYATIPVGVATTIHFLYPLYVALAESFLKRERLRLGTIAALALALAGCMLCAGISGGSGSLQGVILAALSGVGYAAYILFLEHLPGGEMPVYKQMLGISVVGAVICGIFGFFSGRLTLNLQPFAWGMAICAAILVSVVGHGLFQTGERLCDGLDAAVYSLLEPISSFIFSAALLKESLTLSKLAGCVLILCALLIHQRTSTSRSARGHSDSKSI